MARIKPTVTLDMEDYQDLLRQQDANSSELSELETKVAYTYLIGLAIQEPSVFTNKKDITFNTPLGKYLVVNTSAAVEPGGPQVQILSIKKL